MDSIGANLSKYELRKPRKGTPENANCERNEFVGKFTDRLNVSRGTLPKLNYPRIARMLQHLSLQDLHAFWKTCSNANNFGQCFWGLLKVQPKTKVYN